MHTPPHLPSHKLKGRAASQARHHAKNLFFGKEDAAGRRRMGIELRLGLTLAVLILLIVGLVRLIHMMA